MMLSHMLMRLSLKCFYGRDSGCCPPSQSSLRLEKVIINGEEREKNLTRSL